MDEKLDLRNFETGMAALMEKIQLPGGPNGEPMQSQQKQMILSTFITIALMN